MPIDSWRIIWQCKQLCRSRNYRSPNCGFTQITLHSGKIKDEPTLKDW